MLHSVMPHMHMLGKEIKVTMTPPDGKPTTLVHITDWDYNWQETYFLKQPVKVKAGTKFAVEAYYDNSDKNPSNPFNPPQWVRFGEQTDNEMCFVFLGATNDASRRRVSASRGGRRSPSVLGAERDRERPPRIQLDRSPIRGYSNPPSFQGVPEGRAG